MFVPGDSCAARRRTYRVADHHVDRGAVPAGRPGSTVHPDHQPRSLQRTRDVVQAVLEHRPDDPALGRLVEVRDDLPGAVDLVQHAHGDHPPRGLRVGPPERGVRRRAEVDHEPAARRLLHRPVEPPAPERAHGADAGQGDVAREPVGRDVVAGPHQAEQPRATAIQLVARRRAAPRGRRGRAPRRARRCRPGPRGRRVRWRAGRCARPRRSASSRPPGRRPSPGRPGCPSYTGRPARRAPRPAARAARGSRAGPAASPCHVRGRSFLRTEEAGSARAHPMLRTVADDGEVIACRDES